MAARGRQKKPVPQSKSILSFLSPPENFGEKICKQIVDNLIKDVCVQPNDIVAEILNGIVDNVTAVKRKHVVDAVSKKTLSEWKNKYPWLIIESDQSKSTTTMRCNICTEMKPSLKLATVWANEGSSNFQFSAVSRHNESKEHNEANLAYEKQRKLETVCLQDSDSDTNSNPQGSSCTADPCDLHVFNTIYFAAKHEISTNSINSLLELQNKNGLDMMYKNLSWDTITDMQSSIAHVLIKELVHDVKSSGVFALMLDESTDVTVEKRLSVCLRYVKDGEPQTKMLCNVNLLDGRAHTITNCVNEQLNKYGIALGSCISLATDGAAVMLGKHKGVGAQLISKYSPFCVQTHCMAHRINLACTDSIKKNDFMLKFREKFNSLYLFVSASSARTQRLRNIQQLLQEPELSLKEPHSIRWLGLRNAVLAVYESFESVLATLSSFASEKNPVAKGLFKYFCSYKVALVIAFILDVHNELAVLSCGLQKNNILFSEIKPLIDATISKLTYFESSDGKCLSKIKTVMKKNDDGSIMFGDEKLAFHENMESEFLNVKSDYIKRLKKNISDRFRKEDEAIYDNFSRVFEPELVKFLSQKEFKTALDSLTELYGHEKSVTVVEGDIYVGTVENTRVIPPLLCPSKLEEEWPRYEGMIRGSYANLSVDRLCKRVILLHNDIMPNISKLAAIALCLQSTSVECERTFSTQNRLKCKYRASLGTENLNTLMTISMLGPCLADYDATAAVTHWGSKKRRRKTRLFADFKPRAAKKAKLC